MVLVDSTAPTSTPVPPERVGSYDVLARVSAMVSSLARLGVGRLIGLSSYSTLPPQSRDEARASSATAGYMASFINEYGVAARSIERGRGTRRPRRYAADRPDSRAAATPRMDGVPGQDGHPVHQQRAPGRRRRHPRVPPRRSRRRRSGQPRDPRRRGICANLHAAHRTLSGVGSATDPRVGCGCPGVLGAGVPGPPGGGGRDGGEEGPASPRRPGWPRWSGEAEVADDNAEEADREQAQQHAHDARSQVPIWWGRALPINALQHHHRDGHADAAREGCRSRSSIAAVRERDMASCVMTPRSGYSAGRLAGT